MMSDVFLHNLQLSLHNESSLEEDKANTIYGGYHQNDHTNLFLSFNAWQK